VRDGCGCVSQGLGFRVNPIFLYVPTYPSIYLSMHAAIYISRLGLGVIRETRWGTPMSKAQVAMLKPGGGNVTDRESNPRPLGASSGDSTTHLKRSAVMSGTGIHRLIYRDICVERGASYAACAAHNRPTSSSLSVYKTIFYFQSFVVVCAQINRPFIPPTELHCPYCCTAIARLLDTIRPPP